MRTILFEKHNKTLNKQECMLAFKKVIDRCNDINRITSWENTYSVYDIFEGKNTICSYTYMSLSQILNEGIRLRLVSQYGVVSEFELEVDEFVLLQKYYIEKKDTLYLKAQKVFEATISYVKEMLSVE